MVFTTEEVQTKALNEVTLHVEQGEFVAIMGPSGCGKSTTLYMICGLLEPSEGQIFFGEDDVTDLPPEERGVGLVFQNYALYPHLTVRQNILFPLQNFKGADKLSKEEMNARTEAAARLVQIESLLDRKPAELSGGQQQRVALARALAMKPQILLLDEPTSALDPELVGEVLDVIRKVAAQGYTMLLVSHEMNFIRHVSNRVIFLDKGHVVEDGTPKEVFEHPQNQRTREFFSKMHIMAQPEYVI